MEPLNEDRVDWAGLKSGKEVIAVDKGKKWLSGREGRSEMQFVWPRDLLLPGVKSLQMHSPVISFRVMSDLCT
jgi:hypothetical protein